jgi:two-component system phosphate regulon sensor histidine kinase PhoR
MLANGEVPSTKSVFAFNRSNKFRKLIKKALNGKSKERVLEIKDKSYEIMASPVYESNKIVGAVIIVMDVTEKMQRDNYRREFTANVSHELKTPLTSISGFAEIMKSGLVKPEDIPEMASSIYDEAQRLIVLVNDIIKLSALEDESITYENEKINVVQLLEEIQTRLSNVISSKNIDFLIDKNEDNSDIVVEAPKEIVMELFYNLCDNAIKYNKQDGQVRVYVGRDRKKCTVSVSDTGIGIAPEHLERVFERFYRVDKSHSKEVGGTGLGLSIVKHDVNYLDGSISIDSKLDEGTEISVTIPGALVS